MTLKNSVLIGLSLFVMSLASNVSANTLNETVQTLKPIISIEQQDLKKEIGTSAYLKRVSTALAPFLSGTCPTPVTEFTRTQWNNSCNAAHNVYDADVAEYQRITYQGLLAGYIDKVPVFIIQSTSVDAMFFKATDTDSQMKPFIVLTAGLVNTFADNPVAMDFTLRHELGHVQLGHTPSNPGANDAASLQNTTSNELGADAAAVAFLNTKYDTATIKEGIQRMTAELEPDFEVLPATVKDQMLELFKKRILVIDTKLDEPSLNAMPSI